MCPRCGAYAVQTAEVGILDLEYRCTRCGHVWPYAPVPATGTGSARD